MPKKITRQSIQLQVIGLALGFVMLIALAVSAYSFATLYTNIRRSTAQSVEYSLEVAAANLSQSVEEIDGLADWCTVNSTVRSFALSSYKAKDLVRNIYNTVFNKYSSLHTARYLQRFIITDGADRIMQQGTVTAQSRTINAAALATLPGMADYESITAYPSWSEIFKDPLMVFGTQEGIPVVRGLRDQNGRTACVFISVSPALITDNVRDYALTDGCTLYWGMGGSLYRIEGKSLILMGSAEQFVTYAERATLSLLDEKTMVWRDAETNELVMGYPVGSGGMYIAQSLPQQLLTRQLFSALRVLLLAFCIILLLGALLAALLRRTIATPITALQGQLTRIAGGDFTPNPAIEWQNEMGDIGRGINSLSCSITGLMDKRLEDEKQKQDLEYRMLQNQINPHFLYNTLNSIKWMATIQHAPGIAEMTTALSRLLKSVSKGNERLVPLMEEFALLNDYFTIQQYRYGGTITLDVDYIEDETLTRDCLIPRFTLQPLVENAIFHGIEPKDCPGHVTLTVTREKPGGDVLLALKDDGVGMTPEQIAAALTEPGPEEAAAKYRHVGLWNVHRRLQYSFGAGYGLQITSQPGVGTTVTVRLPPSATPKGKEMTDARTTG